jgi:hypothetical protein
VSYNCSERSCSNRRKNDDVKGSFYGEQERVFDKYQKCHMKILLGDFNAKVGRKDSCKPTIGNGSLHEFINGNGVTLFMDFKKAYDPVR